ncbi:sulfite exporter TauE/SafE family protein [Streptomyces sp. NPDC096311]|uniref:sulfite exporter TauE/SafE family protein n=1 Tax=Streptomyces sp. NPDC096311 TaxID=3366083 RepID=UPI003802540D
MIGIGDGAFLTAAGVLAGLVGTAGGITSLISYPALLMAGLPALSANVTNLVAGVACWPGAALVSQPELAGHGPWLRRWVPLSALGGAAGAVLLLSTPTGVFAHVVPFLVLIGSLTLLAQPRLTALHQRYRHDRPSGERKVILPLGLIALSVYGGYFGAGSGVMILALLMVTVELRLVAANALKNMLIGAPALISAASFAAFGPVDWMAAAPLGLGMFVGSTLGPRIARRLPASRLRLIVAVIGIALAIQLWITATD